MHACMHAWMHGCMDAWMDGWMDKCMCVCVYVFVYVLHACCEHAWVDRQVGMYARIHEIIYVSAREYLTSVFTGKRTEACV